MRYKEIISDVSERLGYPRGFVDKVYRAYWKAIREHVSSLPLKGELTDGQFQALQPNVNIPSLGKLYVTLERYRRMKTTHNLNLKNREDATYNKDKADGQPCVDNS